MNTGKIEAEIVGNINFKINKYDLAILISCFESPETIGTLQKLLNIAYKNLNTHLKNLKSYNLISIEEQGKGKPKYVKCNTHIPLIKEFLKGLFIIANVQLKKKHDNKQ